MSDNQEIRRLLFIASSYLSDGSVAYPVTAGEIARSNALDAVMRVRNLLRVEQVSDDKRDALPPSRFLHSAQDDEPKVDERCRYFWRAGWNACRDAALATTPPQPINHTGGHP